MSDKNTREKKNSQGSSEWYTPSKYVEAARKVMGSIELDPASCAVANEIVRAERYYAAYDDGLSHQWNAKTLWMNAPGSKIKGVSGQERWQRHLIAAYHTGRVEQAIMLVFNTSGTETKWFQELLGEYPFCLVNQRIKFIPPAGVYQDTKKNGPVHGNGFVYFGKDSHRFEEVFSGFGKIIPPWNRT